MNQMLWRRVRLGIDKICYNRLGAANTGHSWHRATCNPRHLPLITRHRWICPRIDHFDQMRVKMWRRRWWPWGGSINERQLWARGATWLKWWSNENAMMSMNDDEFDCWGGSWKANFPIVRKRRDETLIAKFGTQRCEIGLVTVNTHAHRSLMVNTC